MSPLKSPPSHGSTSYSKSLLNAMQSSEKSDVSDTVLLISLVPSILSTLKCNYDECSVIVTRIEPKGTISVVINGRNVFLLEQEIWKYS